VYQKILKYRFGFQEEAGQRRRSGLDRERCLCEAWYLDGFGDAEEEKESTLGYE